MKSLDGRNNVKIYNLSAGKSLPDWLTDRKKRKLAKRDVDIRKRIELIQDFDMPDISNCIKVSPDSQYILATGTYKPRVKCFEVSALSLKFERCFDAEVVELEILSEDYSKLIFLQEDRYIEFHNQGGRWFRTRIPKFGRDMTYHYPSCDLYIATAGSEIYRLNLQQGQFLNSLQTDSLAVNKCLFNPVHYLFTCGTQDGKVETWDPRSRHRVGVLDCAMHMISENIRVPVYKSAKDLGVTALAYKDALTLGVGTHTGQILLYDIRSDKPFLVKDHMDGFPIKDLEFHSAHNTDDMVFSLSFNALKIWHKDTGQPHTSIESDVKFNDLCAIPGSGMVFLATEDKKMQVYFMPSLGPAPKWCGHLDALIEELEEEEAPPAYDDYKFVTEQELRQLSLESLVGTNLLRAVMHGYYLDVRLYSKARQAANILDKDHLLKKKVKQKISEQNERKIVKPDKALRKIPNINKEPFMLLKEEAHSGKGERAQLALDVLKDDRFGAMFAQSEFDVNKDTEMYGLIQPFSGKKERKFQQMDDDTDNEEEEPVADQATPSLAPASEEERDSAVGSSSSDSDSIVSDEGESDVETSRRVTPATALKSKKKLKERGIRKTEERKEKKQNLVDSKAASKKIEFVSGDTMEELHSDWKQKKEMTMAERLEDEGASEEDERGTSEQIAHGSRVMKFTLENPTSKKFERLRQQQKEHHKERIESVRKSNKLKGRFRKK